MKACVLLSLVVLTSACATSKYSFAGGSADPVVAKAQFEKLKSLAGEWSGTGGDATQSFPMEVRYRVTAGGSAVEETLFQGTEHEMITLYHMDGNRLMLTHYCAAGNQPSMVARSTPTDGSASTIRFDFTGATNLASDADGHMHEAEITFEDTSHIKSRWTYFQDGKPGHQAHFDLSRKSASG